MMSKLTLRSREGERRITECDRKSLKESTTKDAKTGNFTGTGK